MLCACPAESAEFSGNGPGTITPSSALVNKTLNGEYGPEKCGRELCCSKREPPMACLRGSSHSETGHSFRLRRKGPPVFAVVDHQLRHAAVDTDIFPGDEAGLVGA